MRFCAVVLGSLVLLTGSAIEARAQMGVARGQVFDERGEPLGGVTIEMEFFGEATRKYQRGEPLGGVTIETEFLGEATRKYQTRTDDKGRYTQTLPAGMYRITASREGHRGSFVEYEVMNFEGTRVPDLELRHLERARQARMAPILEKFNKASELTAAGELDGAQKLLEELAAAHPEIPEVHFNLGTIHSQRKEWDSAEAAFERALELKPESIPAGMALSSVYESAGRMEDAIAARAKVAAANPQDVDVHYSLGLLYMNAQRMEEAGKAFERVAELDPQRADVYYLLATVAMNKGDMARAVPHLERYLVLAPEDGAYRASVTQILPSLKASLEEQQQQ